MKYKCTKCGEVSETERFDGYWKNNLFYKTVVICPVCEERRSLLNEETEVYKKEADPEKDR